MLNFPRIFYFPDIYLLGHGTAVIQVIMKTRNQTRELNRTRNEEEEKGVGVEIVECVMNIVKNLSKIMRET